MTGIRLGSTWSTNVSCPGRYSAWEAFLEVEQEMKSEWKRAAGRPSPALRIG